MVREAVAAIPAVRKTLYQLRTVDTQVHGVGLHIAIVAVSQIEDHWLAQQSVGTKWKSLKHLRQLPPPPISHPLFN